MTNKSTFQLEHNRLFSELQEALKYDIAKITGKANGGRSILFVYPPVDDDAYIAEAEKTLTDKYCFIDLRQLLTDFIKEMGADTFKKNYANFQQEVFFSDNFPEETFFYAVMEHIKSVYAAGEIPVLVHTGTLYGMNFSTHFIMDSKLVEQSQIPLIVFYPATVDKDNIYFMGKQVASKYRCIVIK
jgi:hypothetical protein